MTINTGTEGGNLALLFNTREYWLAFRVWKIVIWMEK